MESFGASEINGHIVNQSIDDQSKPLLWKQSSINRGALYKSDDPNLTKSLSKINVFD